MNRKRNVPDVLHFPVRYFPVALDPVSAKTSLKIFAEEQQFQRLLNRAAKSQTGQSFNFPDPVAARHVHRSFEKVVLA